LFNFFLSLNFQYSFDVSQRNKSETNTSLTVINLDKLCVKHISRTAVPMSYIFYWYRICSNVCMWKPIVILIYYNLIKTIIVIHGCLMKIIKYCSLHVCWNRFLKVNFDVRNIFTVRNQNICWQRKWKNEKFFDVYYLDLSKFVQDFVLYRQLDNILLNL